MSALPNFLRWVRHWVVLINSILDGLPLYLMSAMQLPTGILEQIDAKHRAFLWTGKDKAKGGQCLIAWNTACKLKEEGGLGIRRLDTQNSCMLLKLVHRLYNPCSSSWAAWARAKIDLTSFTGEVSGPHWSAVRALLPAYRSFSRVSIGDGRNTNFWLDVWSGNQPLAIAMPALYSHATSDRVSIREVHTSGLNAFLVPRRSRAASLDLLDVQARLNCLVFGEGEDL